jgi:hypothetical protein
MRNSIFAAAIVALVSLFPPGARAAASIEALQKEIAEARRELPKAFNAVARLRQDMPRLDRERHGRLASVGPTLRNIGREGLLPILEQLIAGARAAEMSPTARTAWAVGLLEAAGALRDLRAEVPVLQMLAAETNPDVVRAAAAALVKVSRSAADVLLPLAQKDGPKQVAVVAGLGECREARVTQALSDLLAGHAEEKLARAAAQSLGEMGSLWAWESPDLANSPERTAVRAIAASALVGAYVAYRDTDTRRTLETALLVVDPADAKVLVQKARVQAPDQKAGLDALQNLLENNPLRPPKR